MLFILLWTIGTVGLLALIAPIIIIYIVTGKDYWNDYHNYMYKQYGNI